MNNKNQFLNRQAPQEHQDTIGSAYPLAQWHNGVGNLAPNPLLANGGFELPEKHFGPYIGDKHPVISVPHGNGLDDAYMFSVLHLSVLQIYTDYWKRDGAGNTDYSPVAKWDEGYKSRIQIFCFIKEIEEISPRTPCIISLKSTAAKTLLDTVKQFRAQILNTVDRLVRANGGDYKAPHYSYWLPTGSNGQVSVGQGNNKSMAAPLVGFWDSEIANLTLESTLAPLEDLQISQSLFDHIVGGGYDEALTWLEQQTNQPAESTPAQALAPPSVVDAQPSPQPELQVSAPVPTAPQAVGAPVWMQGVYAYGMINYKMTDEQMSDILRGKFGDSLDKDDVELYKLVLDKASLVSDPLITPKPAVHPQTNGEKRQAKIASGFNFKPKADELCKNVHHYRNESGGTNMYHILNTATLLGFKTIKAENVDAVVSALADRVAVSALADRVATK